MSPSSHEPFRARHLVEGGRHVLVLSGELDIFAAPRLEETLIRLAGDGTTAVVLDLRKTTFIDSTGLRAILLGKELTDERGLGFSIVPGPPNVQRLFEVASLLEVLPFEQAGADPGSDVETPHA